MDVNASRFAAKLTPGDNGCVLWTGGLTRDGYGKFYHDGRVTLSHRWAWENAHGPVPQGLELDHLCRVRNCVNLAHLEPVTRQVNATRGVGFAGLNARKTHCPAGHPYSGANLRIAANGARICRECDRAKVRRYKARRSA